MSINKLSSFLGMPLKTSICALHSDELIYGIKDASNQHKAVQLSDAFGDLLVRCELVNESAELNQIGNYIGVDIFPICEMYYFWDEEDKAKQLSLCQTQSEKEEKRALIEEMNRMLAKNIDIVYATVVYMNAKLKDIHQLDEQLVDSHDSFINYQTYFGRSENESAMNFFTDIGKIVEFMKEARQLGLDTFYFKMEENFH